ncbi:MAG TPA: hypothetical protein VK149_09230 [Sideroxyarcus sp.]|nr:hypothetical protein [Sideroxyarcus sp.]
MARSSRIPAKKQSAHGDKRKHSRPALPAEDGPHRKTSMNAYYRPQQRIVIAELWDPDEMRLA